MHHKILIIGGSSGLGKQLAILYSNKGNTVGIIARREKLLEELTQTSPNILMEVGDISVPGIEQTILKLVHRMGGMSICIIAASVISFNPSLASEPEQNTVAVNVKGVTSCILAAWNYFKIQGKGNLAVVTSVAAARGNKLAPAYHASKSFQSVYLQSLQVKASHEQSNIHITEIIPGYINTDMGIGNRKFWVISPERAAKLVVRAISKNKRRAFITGRWRFVYYITRILPWFIYKRIVNSKVSF